MNKVELFKKYANQIAELYAVKNTAYGDSFGQSFQKYGPISGLTRMSDKWNRFENLILNPSIDYNDERIQDTLIDLAAYAIMFLIEIDGGNTDDNIIYN